MDKEGKWFKIFKDFSDDKDYVAASDYLRRGRPSVNIEPSHIHKPKIQGKFDN